MTTSDIMIDSFGRIKDVATQTIENLDADALTFRPSADANTIAWLVWHLARVEDDHVSALAGKPQIWEQWREKFNLPFKADATGYGQSPDEVAHVKASAELLIDYLDAVTKASIEYLVTLDEADYDRVVDTNWDPPVTMGVRLVSVIADCLQHVGQAGYVKGLH